MTTQEMQNQAVAELKKLGIDKPTLEQIAIAQNLVEAANKAVKGKGPAAITFDISKPRKAGFKADGTPLPEKQAKSDKGSLGGGFLIRGLGTFPMHFYKSQFQNFRARWDDACKYFDEHIDEFRERE